MQVERQTHPPQLDRESAGTLESDLGWNPSLVTSLLNDPNYSSSLSFNFLSHKMGGNFSSLG